MIAASFSNVMSSEVKVYLGPNVFYNIDTKTCKVDQKNLKKLSSRYKIAHKNLLKVTGLDSEIQRIQQIFADRMNDLYKKIGTFSDAVGIKYTSMQQQGLDYAAQKHREQSVLLRKYFIKNKKMLNKYLKDDIKYIYQTDDKSAIIYHALATCLKSNIQLRQNLYHKGKAIKFPKEDNYLEYNEKNAKPKLIIGK